MAGLLVDVQHALQAHNGVGPSPFHTLAKLLNSFLAWHNCGEMEEKWTDLLTGWKEIKKLYFFILLHFSILLSRCSHFYHEILGQVCHYTAWSCQMTSHIELGLIFQELSYLKKHQQDEKTLENTNLIRSKHFVCTFLPFFFNQIRLLFCISLLGFYTMLHCYRMLLQTQWISSWFHPDNVHVATWKLKFLVTKTSFNTSQCQNQHATW